MSALVIVLGLWALGLVALAWVVVLSRMMAARREADQMEVDDRWWRRVRVIELPGPWGIAWYDTLPGQRP